MKPYRQESTCDHTTDRTQFFNDVYPTIRHVAGIRAAAVAKACGLSRDEMADLEQDAALLVWRKLNVFDSRRSSLRTFVERMVANRMVSSIRRVRAEKRRALPAEWTPAFVPCEADSVNLRVDVLRVLSALSPAQRDVCRMLSEHSPTEVSRRAGVCRAAIYRMIGDLRIVFIDAGLEHCPKSKVGAALDLPCLSAIDVASADRRSRQMTNRRKGEIRSALTAADIRSNYYVGGGSRP
jgi:DNA-directed RNA polymerase specialized sigma24 family protein